jgi:hypothetical protein
VPPGIIDASYIVTINCQVLANMIPVRRYAALQAEDPLARMALDDTQHVTELGMFQKTD